MLLVLEVGNTNTHCGLYEHGRAPLRSSFRLSTVRDRMPDEWLAMLAALLANDGLDLGDIDAVVLSSVVPQVTSALAEMTRTRLNIEPLVIDPALDLGIRLLVDEPEKVGADRIVDCIAAHARYGGPAIIIDLGTATTFDVTDGDGNYLGGAIAAGVGTSLKALAANAAQLFSVELKQPERIVGRTTAAQLQSGIVEGHQAMLEGMILRIRGEIGVNAPVILTGGFARLFAGRSPLFDHYDPDLTIDGLRMIHDRIAGSGGGR
ncbi:MAG: type III pantothenate kinase [Chloroflexota bacterium]